MKIYAFLRSVINSATGYRKKKFIDKLVQNGLKLGKGVYIVSDFFFDPSHCFLISIGDNTTIAPNVRLIAHDASTKNHLGYTKIGLIEIGKNCFIGDSVIVLPNVKIGDNSIIGAGSVVTKDVPVNSIAVGNPAKVISSLQEYLSKVENIDGKKIFGSDYYINNLDQKKRNEILSEVKNGTGFIV